MEFTWSSQQEAIFEEFRSGTQNVIVSARAGTGKTTTIIRAIDFAPEKSILLCAFNKRIEEHLTRSLRNPNARAKTLHGLGYGYVQRAWAVKVEPRERSGQRAEGLSYAACGRSVPDPIIKLVTKLHSKAREMAPYAKREGELLDILYKFDLEPDEGWIRQGYDASYVEAAALKAMVIAAASKPAEIDFADMIYLPLRNGWVVPMFGAVVVDEYQDMTSAQLDLALGACRGRVIVVGDKFQAIYGFRGADMNSLERLNKQLNAVEYPLTETYRCGKVITRMAQALVPDITAHEKNPHGQINTLNPNELTDAAQHGDFIISRVNAPLVPIAMDLLKRGKRARIAGKDVGAGLKSLIKKVARPTDTVDTFLEKLARWEEREVQKWTVAERPDRATAAQDKAEMLRALAEDAVTLRHIEVSIDALFTDDGLGAAGIITCSTVHKAKGLEALRVFIIWDTVSDRKEEERNIKYVAITRAIEELILVTKHHRANEPLASYTALGSNDNADYFLCSAAERRELWAAAMTHEVGSK
jgi:DNA helicase-2/ATP-dependent DNA helicase PcrA